MTSSSLIARRMLMLASRRLEPWLLEWQFFSGSLQDRSARVAAAADGGVYAGTRSSQTIGARVRKLNAEGGTTNTWSVNLGLSTGVRSLRVGRDGSVCVGQQTGIVRKLSADGVVQWTYTLGSSSVEGVDATADGHVYAAFVEGFTVRITPSGATDWVRGSSTPLAVAADAAGDVCIGHQSGQISKISASEETLWSITPSASPVRRVVEYDGRFITAADGGVVRALDGATGDQLWALQLAEGSSSGLSVDGAGFIYVAYGGAVWKLTPGGQFVASNLYPSLSGLGAAAEGHIFLGYSTSPSVTSWTVQKVTPPAA